MFPKRFPYRRLINLLILTALLWSQWFVSVYACSMLSGNDIRLAAFAHDSTLPCHQESIPNSNPNFCFNHCTAGDQTTDSGIATLLSVPAPVVLTTITFDTLINRPQLVSTVVPLVTDPPVSIRFHVFLS